MIHVILSDLHGRLDKTREVLDSAGVITVNSADPFTDTRNEGFHVIQLGDAVSLGYDEQEANFYKWFLEVVRPDETLIGNHELPAVWHHVGDVEFYGWGTEDGEYKFGRDPVATHMVKLRYAEGNLKAATHVGKWLITHAGVAIRYQKTHSYLDVPAELIADDLNGRFKRCMDLITYDDVISNCRSDWGGVFWLRFEYLNAGYHAKHIPQIVGHSGYSGPKQHRPNLWCIDTPAPSKRTIKGLLASGNGGLTRGNLGGVCALVTEDEGENFEVVYVP